MNRKDFLKATALLPFIPASMKLDALNSLANSLENTRKMPVLFIGHGNPMNAIEENEFVKGFRKVGTSITKPKAILCVSAHWETKGTQVTGMMHPRTIHDFGGFPRELHEVEYPAPGSPELAKTTQELITKTDVSIDQEWGLDHGAWTVIKHMYPDADVPVIQLSLDYTKSAQEQYDIAKQLTKLREKGILIIGSGNMVHNLRMVAWDKLKGEPYAYDWATEANDKMKHLIEDGNDSALIDYKKLGKSFDLAIPTPEHYLPLLYTLALRDAKDEVSFFNDKPVGGSLTMTSVKIEEPEPKE